MKTELEIISHIRKIIRAVDIYSNRLKEKYGLNSSQLTCLDFLNRSGSQSISELGKQMDLSPSMLTNIIDQLENRMLVKRVRSDKDRRVIKIEMTEHGQAILKQAPTFLHKKLEHNLSKLSNKEKGSILVSLQTLVSSLEAEDVDSSPILASGETIVGEPEITISNEGKFKTRE